MNDELTFYTHPMSRGRIVRWMLEEVGRPYRTELPSYETLKEPAFRALNPMGKLPVVRHGETVITECAAICAYLADAFPEAGLAPPSGDHRRGPYYRWLMFAAGPIEASVTNLALKVEIPEERRRMVGYGSMADVISTLETALTDVEYLAGDAFTAADLYLGSQLTFGLQFGTIEKRPVFERYVERLNARPAAIRARQIDDALIAAAKAGAPA